MNRLPELNFFPRVSSISLAVCLAACLAACFAACLAVGCSVAFQPALAAENSTGNSLGFSRDGNHFVFEEYGTTDGLGLPYVNLYGIDIAGDRWVKGTPVRLRGTEEEAIAFEKKLADDGITDRWEIEAGFRETANQKRLQAQEVARPALAPLGKLSAAQLQVYNPPHEFTSNAKQVRFSLVGYRTLVNSSTSQDVWRLNLAEFKFPAKKECFEQYDSMKGFSLRLTNEASGTELVLNKDARVPKSRGCPQKYYIEQVLTYARPDGSYSLAVLVRYSLPGFEGPDGRLLAVTAIVDPQN